MGILSFLSGKKQKPDLRQLVKDQALIIDVRTKAEFARGHITGSINIPLDDLANQVKELKMRNATVITCCQSGNRSGVAKKILESAGLTAFNGGPWNLLDQQIK